MEQSEQNLHLRSTVSASSLYQTVPRMFGPPGAADFRQHPGSRTQEDDPQVIFNLMAQRKPKPLEDAKILRGTVYSKKNRYIITKWIRDVCAAFNLRTTTFNLAVQLTDTFMFNNLQAIAVNRCQLIALSSLWIAAKFEELEPQVPTLQALTDVCDRAYSKPEIVQTEEELLRAMRWKLQHTTMTNFAYLYLHVLTCQASQFLPKADPAQVALWRQQPGSVLVTLLRVKTDMTESDLVEVKGLDYTRAMGDYLPVFCKFIGVPEATPLQLHILHGEAIVFSSPVGVTDTINSLAAIYGQTLRLFARPVGNTSCVFAERGDASLLRSANLQLLRLIDALTREALVHVEFTQVEAHAIALAALICAVCMISDSIVEAERRFGVLCKTLGLSLTRLSVPVATRLLLEKYKEALAGDTPVGPKPPSQVDAPSADFVVVGERVEHMLTALAGSKASSEERAK